MVDRHLFNMLSYTILYKTSFFIVKGLALLVNHCFCHVNKDFLIVCKFFLTSFNHFSYVKNKLTFVVCFGILEGSVTSGNLDETYVIA